MNFLIISDSGDGWAIGWRIAQEGNNVTVWTRNPNAVNNGRGLIVKAYDWKSSLDEDTIIISDATGSGIILDMLKKSGYLVCCGSEFADRLEMDRKFSNDIFQSCGINIPKSKEFHDFESGKEFAKNNPEYLVFKPCGESSGVLPSRVGKSLDDLLEFMDYAPKLIEGEVEYELQEFIKGKALSTEGWFDGEKFLEPFNCTIESKKFLDGDIGENVGCAGNVVFLSEGYTDELLSSLTGCLYEEDYIGPIDLNCMMSDKGILVLEPTPRFGYDAIGTLIWGLFNGELGKFFSDLVRKQSKSIPLKDKFAGGISVSITPYPAEQKYYLSNIKINGLDKNFKDFFPYSVMKGKSDSIVTSGLGNLGVSIGTGSDIKSAMDSALQKCKSLNFSGIQYRQDLGTQFQRDYEEIFT